MNMRKYAAIVFLSGMFLVCGGADTPLPLLVQWDFTAGNLTSANGKYALRLRGNTVLEKVSGKTMLRIGMSRNAEGAQFCALYKELCPQGPLRYEFTVRMREPDSPLNMQVLFDSKYSFYNPSSHSGLALVLNRFQNDPRQYRMTVYAGFAKGCSLTFYCSKAVRLEEGNRYTLAYEYDGKDTFSFFLDGKKIGAQTRKDAGPLQAPVKNHGVVGDRFNSGYCHFQGDILSVRIFGKP